MKRVSRTTEWRRKKARARLRPTACCPRHENVMSLNSSDEEVCNEAHSLSSIGGKRLFDEGTCLNDDHGSQAPRSDNNDIDNSGEDGYDCRRAQQYWDSSDTGSGDNSSGDRRPQDDGAGDDDPHDSSSDEETEEEDDNRHPGDGGGDDDPSDGSDEEETDGNEDDDNRDPEEPDDPDDPHDGSDEEEPDRDEDYNRDPEEPDDPDDPDVDPDDDASSDEELGNFSFNHDLNILCESTNRCSVREVVALVLALCTRHSVTYEALINLMKVLNVVHGRSFLPIDKKCMWRLLGRRTVGIFKTVYCPKCRVGHGPLRHLAAVVHCGCGHTIQKQSCKYFISLDLKSQLRELLRKQDVKDALRVRQQGPRNQNVMSDVMDGHQYRLLQAPGNILEGNVNFSYTFNTDGFRLAKSSSAEAWPVFVRWTELPWNLRQKHMILAGVWVDLQHPNMNLLLEKFVHQANELSNDGILWAPEAGREMRSKFFPLCCVVDSQARCQMLNLNAPSGYNSCPLCDHRGLYVGGSVHYPFLPPIPVPVRRTDDSIKENMLEATRLGNMVQGFRGPSQLMLMDHFDLGVGVVTDDLHPFSGVVQDHLEILLSRVEGQRQAPEYYIGTPRSIALIDARLTSIRTPTHLSRKPRPLKTRSRWKGSEWRNFLLYYLVPVLYGILPNNYLRHFQLLAQAVFIVSRDAVTEADCDVAHGLFQEYVAKFERFFGRERMVPNVHILLHVSECVKNWGPAYGHSTTFFESWNHELLKTVTSPHATADQIVTRFFMWRFLNNIEEDELISERIKNEVRRLLDNPRLRDPEIIGNVHLLGKSTARQPSQQEHRILVQNNEHANHFVEYKRARCNGVEFRCAGYRYAGAETKSDNSQIYTLRDEFCQIITIAAFGNNMDRRVAAFCKIYNTNANVNRYVSKIAEGDDVIVLKYFQQIRSLAIMCSNASGTYVMPVANIQELD